MEIFSGYGIPNTLIIDQGSVFLSAMTKQLCKVLEIEKWHSYPNNMFKKSDAMVKDWDFTLKDILFAYRTTPHTMTGFLPADLLNGRLVKGPLDLIRTSWIHGEVEQHTLSKWLANSNPT